MPSSAASAERVVTDDCRGWFFGALGPGPHPGVLLLHGAGGGGGYELAYARQLAHHGFSVLCPEYFGAPGVPDVLEAVPLSVFEGAAAALRDRPSVADDRIGVVGFSRGGEAALLVGATLDRVGAVVAYSASGYVFPAPTWMPGVDEEGPAWTREGEPVPYVPLEPVPTDQPDGPEAMEVDDGVCVRAVDRAPDDVLERAAIPVERVYGPVCCVSGGSDRIWDAATLADVAIRRLERHDHPWPAEHHVFPDAGHAIRVPYEPSTTAPEQGHDYGGTHAATARAAAEGWRAALRTLETGLVER